MDSHTTWTRLEPRTRDRELADGLRAAIHDPIWLLGRQWQTGELVGEDAGSPVDATVSLAVDPMARGRPGGVDGSGPDVVFEDGTGDGTPTPPLETLAEREAVRPEDSGDRDLRLAAEAGAHFLRLLAPDFGVDASAFPESALLEPDDRDEDTERYTAVVGGRALDGDELYDAYDFQDFGAFQTAVASDSPPPLPDVLDTSDAAELQTFWAVVEDYRAWYADFYSEADRATDAWAEDRLEYAYAVSTGSGENETVLTSGAYEGGRLDWYDFSVDPESTLEPAEVEWSGPSRTSVSRSLVPTPTSFDGMPAERWWEFEDKGVDLSAVEAAPEDLSRLLLLEFSLVYGNDWFTVPIDLPVGSLSRVETVELETSFDETIAVEDAVVENDDPTTNWNVYSMALDARGDERGLFLAPTLVEAVESTAVESVEFARDETANLAWAIESTIEGGVGQPRNRAEEAAGTADPPPVATTGDADVAYQLATDVPDNWFPLVPRQVSLGDVQLELGRLLVGDGPPPEPLGEVLEADTALPEEEVARTGETVDRRYQYTRWIDGSTYCWSGRETTVGSGGTSSGLSFDELVDPRTGDPDETVGEPDPFPEAQPVPESARLEITDAQFQTPGAARENLDRETVTFTNVGGRDLDLTGWRVADAAGNDYTFEEGTVLGPGATLTLHTGTGRDTDADVYWGRSQFVWNDTGDTVHVFQPGTPGPEASDADGGDGGLVLMRSIPARPPDVSGQLTLAAIVADPTGPEPTAATDEFLVFENTGESALDISGWRVEDAVGHRYAFPGGTELPAGGSVSLHTGPGSDRGTDLYWGRGTAVWNNTGDTLSVFAADGTLALRHSY